MHHERDELGAHVSTAGGPETAPGRARDIDVAVFQIFTKQPNRWVEPQIAAESASAFQSACVQDAIRMTVAHDSYLINLSTPNPELWERSVKCFEGELRRSTALGLDAVVTHPGNATDGDAASGLARNADGVARALEAVPGSVRVLLEITAGSGTSVGATFENLRTIIDGVPAEFRNRVGVCFDTCHALAAGYDLVNDFDGVWREFDDVIGSDRLQLFHLNDSQHPLGSRKDRHEHLGAGHLGEGPFRRLVTDDRFTSIPKVLETPKGDDGISGDVENLSRLRGWRSEARGG